MMKGRCYNERCKDFKNYGARGITVCDRWRTDYTAFIADMGPKPGPGYSVDRINNEGNYEPGNCRWATAKEQALNSRPHLMAVARKAAELNEKFGDVFMDLPPETQRMVRLASTP